MQIISDNFREGGKIPGALAFAVPDPATHIKLASNRNPHLRWSGAPAGTKSFVLICHDRDVPSKGDDVNQEGRTIPATLPRVDFYHWVLVDIPATLAEIKEGEFSSAVTARGKPGPAAAHGTRQGVNDYTGWFAGDKDMAGNYFGYDGPCPPWNDSILHHYAFTIHALDVAKCGVSGTFRGPDVLAAIKGHVLASAGITAGYALNPSVST